MVERLKIEHGLVYASMAGRELTLDLHWHPAASQPQPVIVWIHGGAWMMGDRSWVPPKLPLVDDGFAMTSIDYRLSHEAVFPAQIEDCKAAIRWLRANAQHYILDRDRVGVWGESSGGHLAALLGTSSEVTTWDRQGGNEGYSSEVQAVCDWFGSSDLLKLGVTARYDHNAADSPASRFLGGSVQQNKERAILANPITHITATAAPFLIMHGEQDDVVPVSQSELLHCALVEAGVKSTLRIIPEMGHEVLALSDERRAELYGDVIGFFRETLGVHKGSSR